MTPWVLHNNHRIIIYLGAWEPKPREGEGLDGGAGLCLPLGGTCFPEKELLATNIPRDLL